MDSSKDFCKYRTLSEDEDIVISGLSGRFPNSHNVTEFAHNLYNKVDMVDDTDRRFRPRKNIPQRHGKIYDIEKFDALFFGINPKLANAMHPQLRCVLETAYEALLDAGINPEEISGTKTGVYSGVCELESLSKVRSNVYDGGAYTLIGENRGMFANRLSYAFNLKGPSFSVDSACSSAMMALQCAYDAIRSGECDAALVTASNLCLAPVLTQHFAKMGVLAPDGYCRPFDEKATGYTRSEAITVLFLQKRKDARRCHATIVHSKINCDGYKSNGITFPSSRAQKTLLEEFYHEIDIKPNDVNYVEAHATGTIIGDPEECDAIYEVFCRDRNAPLPIGSVKSNMGHAEPASGLCSIIKCVLAFQSGKIPPNINFENVRKDIEPLENGSLKVLDEITDLPGPLIACNSYGFGGANGHVLLKRHTNVKINHDSPNDGLPRLVCWSGRTEESCNIIFDELCTKPLDTDFIALLQNCQSKAIKHNVYRGYGIFKQQNGDINASCVTKEVINIFTTKRPIVWVFTGMGSQYKLMGSSLMSVPIFRETIEKCHNILKEKNIDLINILTSSDADIYENILYSVVGIVAIQIGLVNILKALDIEPDYIIGHSAGEISCGYADGCFTLEETILTAYSRGRACLETEIIPGAMAAVDLGYQELLSMLPSGIEIACRNGVDSCTISGPIDIVRAFTKQLHDDGAYAKEVACVNIPYHSKYIAEVGPRFETKLEKIIECPKPRSSKWISTSLSEDQSNCPEFQLCSPKYQANNLVSPVLFDRGIKLLPENSLTLEIAPQGLLQAILRRNMPEASYISLTSKETDNNLNVLFQGLGKLYTHCVDMPIHKLYPKVQFPVSVGTPMISSLIQKGWDHTDDWFVPKFDDKSLLQITGQQFHVSLSEEEFRFISGHKIGNKKIFPGTGYLYMVWEAFANVCCYGMIHEDIPVKFTDVKFLRATIFTGTTKVLTFTIVIHPGTGHFEITESGSTVCTGCIKRLEEDFGEIAQPPIRPNILMLETDDLYKEARLRGLYYKGEFQCILEEREDAMGGKIKWNNNMVTFMDGMLQINGFADDTRITLGISGFESVEIDYKKTVESVKLNETGVQYIDVINSRKLQIIQAGGVRFREVKVGIMPSSKPPHGEPVLESYNFVPYIYPKGMNVSDAICAFVQIWLENAPSIHSKIVEVAHDSKEYLLPFIQNSLEDTPLVTAELILLTNSSDLNLPGITITSENKLSDYYDCTIVVGSDYCSNLDNLESVAASCKKHTFIISKEHSNIEVTNSKLPPYFDIISVIPEIEFSLVMLQYNEQRLDKLNNIVHIKMDDKEFQWIDEIKQISSENKICLVSQGEPTNGILGFVNCLRREPGIDATCVFIHDSDVPEFDPEIPFYKEQLVKNLAINVFKNGEWGSYRHLPLNVELRKEKPKHYYANNLIKGDISSLSWIQGSLDPQESNVVAVEYSALNFKDIVIATGRADLTPAYHRLKQDCILGFEYSGITHDGKRVMGTVEFKAISSHVESIDCFTWEVPKEWSLEGAATVPVAYSTVYTAFFAEAHIEAGKKVLIHAGTGGVGLAAIQVALAYGLEVYTTVSTQEKRQYLLERFPELTDSHIGNSRDTSFYNLVMEATDGLGVDYVLNSLSEDKLIASLKCLGEGGHFLEIGRFDILFNNKIGLGDFLKGITFHTIMLDIDMKKGGTKRLNKLHGRIEKDLKRGIIVPIRRTVFEAKELGQAFKYLALAKHIGKVLIKIRNDNNGQSLAEFYVKPRIYFKSHLCYIVIGGLGGFGLELCDWMILRGCRKLLISSRKGITQSYQQYRMNIWNTYKVHIEISTTDITTQNGCLDIIEQAERIGPVGGIFNLAAILNDKVFENQTVESFKETLIVKADVTKYLDEISRNRCSNLEHFIVFSSISCGRGNPGQTNYGMGNSIMERIIEARVSAGFPGKAIQWGAVGDVGLAINTVKGKIEKEMHGIQFQSMNSCLYVLDKLLACSDPIVSTMVVAKKNMSKSTNTLGIVEYLKNAFNIKEMTPEFLKKKLFDIGLDSLMTVELMQVLERDYDVTVPLQNVRNLTVQDLIDLANKKAIENKKEKDNISK